MFVAAQVAVAAAVMVGLGEVLLALAVVVPLAVLLTRRPQAGVVVLVALLPFDGLLLLVPHPFVVNGWKEALVIATVLATFLAPASARRTARPLTPGWALAAFGLFAACALAAAVHPGLAAIYDLKIQFFYALVVVAVWRCPLDQRERDRVVGVLMFTVVVTAAYGIAQQFIGYQRLHELGYEYNTTIRFNGSVLRSFSSFTAPFEFAYFLTIAGLVCLAAALRDPDRPRNFAFIALLPIVSGGLAVSGIRAGWLGTAIGLAYLGFRRHRSLLFAAPLAAVALLLAAVYLPSGVSTTALSSASSQERVTNWRDNLKNLTRNPLGAGLGTSSAAAGKAQELRGVTDVDYYEPDNQYFFWMYETGAIGLWWYVLFLVYLWRAVRRARVRRPDEPLVDGFAAVVLAIATMSLVGVIVGTYPANPLMWILLAVLVAAEYDAAADVTPAVAPVP